MKENWKTKPLIEFCNEVTDGSHFSPKTSIDFQYPYITVRDIVRDKIIFEGCKRLEKKDYLDLVKNGCKPEFGDLLFSKDGTVGKVALVEKKEDFVVLSSLALIRPNREIIAPEFLKYVLLNPAFIKEAVGKKTGVAIRRIILRNLKQINIHVPDSLEEQKQIVAILDKAFAAIDQAKANIEKNIENAKELFQSKLNDIFSQKGDGWEEKRLGEVCSLFQGLAINKKTKHLLVGKSSLPLIRIKDLKNNTEVQFVAENGYPENAKVDIDDIIYTRTGSLGLVFRNRKGILHNNSFKVVPTSEISRNYLFWWLQHEAFTKIIIGLASRAAQPDITHKLFKQQAITYPSLIEQEKYYLLIEELNKETEAINVYYQQKLNNLEDLKKSILQKAFAGELTQKEVVV